MSNDIVLDGFNDANAEVVDIPLGDVVGGDQPPAAATLVPQESFESFSSSTADDDFSPPPMNIPFTDETATLSARHVVGCLRDRTKDVVLSGWYTIFYAILLLMNLMIVVLVLCALHRSAGFVLLDLAVNCTFVLDIALRIFALGKTFFWLDIPGEGMSKILRQPWFNWLDLVIVVFCGGTFIAYVNRLNDTGESVVETLVIMARSAVILVRIVVRIVLQCRRARTIATEEYVNFDVMEGMDNGDWGEEEHAVTTFGLV